MGYVWCDGYVWDMCGVRYVWDMCGVRYANNLLKNPATKRLSGKTTYLDHFSPYQNSCFSTLKNSASCPSLRVHLSFRVGVITPVRFHQGGSSPQHPAPPEVGPDDGEGCHTFQCTYQGAGGAHVPPHPGLSQAAAVRPTGRGSGDRGQGRLGAKRKRNEKKKPVEHQKGEGLTGLKALEVFWAFFFGVGGGGWGENSGELLKG